MSSSAEIIYDAAAERIMEMLGIDAEYSGNGNTFKVVVNTETTLNPDGLSGQVWSQMTTLECLTADAGGEPARDATFTIGANEYVVKEILNNDNRFVKMRVKIG